MKMTKIATKCAAVLCAAAIMLPAVGAAPASFVLGGAGNVIVASASETGDTYVPVGEKFTFDISMPSDYLGSNSLSDFTFQWYYSDTQSGTMSWNKISGATGTSYSDTMTSAKNLRHYKVEVTNTKNGEKHDLDWFPMRTVTSNFVTTKLGTASTETKNGKTYVKVPVTVSGLYKNLLTGYTYELKYDSKVFDSITFVDSTKLSDKDEYDVEAGDYIVCACAEEPVTVSSGNIGYFYLGVKSGATYNGSTISLVTNDLTASGSTINGVITYGTSTSSTKISTGGSTTTNLYPVVQTQVKDHKIGFKWNKIQGAEKYGIGVYQANKWVVKKQVDSSVTTWTSPQVANGTYRLVVLAKVNGQWVSADVFKHSFYVTVK